MKKRILSMALALALALSLCVPALAAEEPAADPSGDAAPTQRLKEVHYTYLNQDKETSETTYEFSYSSGGAFPTLITSSDGREVTCVYDEEGRVLSVHNFAYVHFADGSDGESITDFVYTYDADGRLSEENDGIYVTAYQYDAEGRLMGYTQTSDYIGNDFEYKYDYDPSGESAVVTFTDKNSGNSYEYTVRFDDAGRLIEDGLEVREYSYAPGLRVGYSSSDMVNGIGDSFNLDGFYNNTFLWFDFLDAAGTPINFADFVVGWYPPINMTYDDAGYLVHAESSLGCVADFTYEPVA